MRETIIAGNWKQNGDWSLCEQFIRASEHYANDAELSRVQLVLCPPSLWISELSSRLTGAWCVGAQNLSAEADGAFTGEISGEMLGKAGATFCIVGHSERRSLYSESDEVVCRKLEAAKHAGLRPILCVGEDLDCREAGHAVEFVTDQLLASTKGMRQGDLQNLIVAYEPVWAIGTGKVASEEQVQSMHAAIRRMLVELVGSASNPLLYGGSVKPDNAVALLALPDVDGALVGGASLQIEDFLAIGRAA